MYMNDGNGIYERFNIQRPADFTGHSLSVSDVVVLNDGSTVKAYYVDSIGFAELPEFFKERNGCVNNVPQKPRRIGGRWSVLDRLHIKQAERRQKDNTPQQEQERSRKS